VRLAISRAQLMGKAGNLSVIKPMMAVTQLITDKE
jgi:hypothetical protein